MRVRSEGTLSLVNQMDLSELLQSPRVCRVPRRLTDSSVRSSERYLWTRKPNENLYEELGQTVTSCALGGDFGYTRFQNSHSRETVEHADGATALDRAVFFFIIKFICPLSSVSER